MYSILCGVSHKGFTILGELCADMLGAGLGSSVDCHVLAAFVGL